MHGMEQIKLIFHVRPIYVSPLKFYAHFSSAPCALSALPIPAPSFHYHNDIQFGSRIMKFPNKEFFAPPATSSLQGHRIALIIAFAKTINLCSAPDERD